MVVVCDNEVEKRREPRIPANTKLKVNTSQAVRCWEEWAVERNVKIKKNSSREKYYEVNPRQKYNSTDEGMIPTKYTSFTIRAQEDKNVSQF